MKINRAYKVELDPNQEQVSAFRQHAGMARWVYNWGLDRKISSYKETKKSPSSQDLSKSLTLQKTVPKEEGGCPWMEGLCRSVATYALRDLDQAFKNFFARCKKGATKKGFPKFKSRHKSGISFRLQGAKVTEEGRHVHLPSIGKVRLKERGYLPSPSNSNVKIMSATVSCRADKWFLSLTVEEEIPNPVRSHDPKVKVIVGVDVGISNMAVTSDGVTFTSPKALRKAQAKLKRAQRSLSRKQKGGKNREKAKRKLQKVHYRVSCIRNDALHKATDAMLHGVDVICIETLNVKGMMKNHALAGALSDSSLGELHRQIEYKAGWRGIEVVKAPRFFPSSKTCSGCGQIKQDLTLKDRVFTCTGCGLVIDRDLNAAINLQTYAASLCTASSAECAPTPPLAEESEVEVVKACGEDVRLEVTFGLPQAASVKQELPKRGRRKENNQLDLFKR